MAKFELLQRRYKMCNLSSLVADTNYIIILQGQKDANEVYRARLDGCHIRAEIQSVNVINAVC